MKRSTFVGSTCMVCVAACGAAPRDDGDAFGTGVSTMKESTSGESSGQPGSGPGGDQGEESGAVTDEGTSGSLTTTATSATGAGTSSSGGDDGGVDDGFKFDTPEGGVTTTAGEGSEGCGCGSIDWSYVWIANTKEGTVSKINTRTLVEEGRYITRPDKGGSPSRTSVSVDGKAVVVANRFVGLVKIWARPEFCKGGNTSTGKTDVKAWGSDDCVAWYTDFPDATVQRPVAWTTGTRDPTTCQYVDQKVWTTTGKNGGAGTCREGGVWVHRLDGETGMVEDTIPVPEFTCADVGFGPYGGAVDYQGNFWFQSYENDKLARVDFATLAVEIFDGQGYGITVDTKGRVWMSNSITRFDYAAMTWATANASTSGGIAQDLQGRIWAAGQNGVVWVDMETMAVGGTVTLPTPPQLQFPPRGQVKGVSVDIDGFIWAVQQDDTKAYKIDPNTFAYEFYDGLNGPYTYSDMTGGQISNIGCNPPEG